MALIKSNQFSDISGRIGGSVFKRDKSGLHITAKARTVKKQQTIAERRAKNWYANLKHDEYADNTRLVPDEPPKTPQTFKAYSLSHIYTYRDPSIFEPEGAIQPDDPEIKQQAGVIMYEYWFLNLKKYGITQNEVIELFVHYLFIAHYTWGIVMEDCWAEALKASIAWWDKCILIGKIIRVTGFVAAVAACVIYSIGEFLEEHWGKLIFYKWDILLWNRNSLYLGGIQSRPTEDMYDICIGPILPFPEFFAWLEPHWQPGRLVFFTTAKTFQYLTFSAFLWYTWTFNEIHCANIGNAYDVEYGIVRCQVQEWAKWYLEMPVGYSRTPDEALQSVYNIHNLFIHVEEE